MKSEKNENFVKIYIINTQESLELGQITRIDQSQLSNPLLQSNDRET